MTTMFTLVLTVWWPIAAVLLHKASLCQANTTEVTTTAIYTTQSQKSDGENKNLILAVLRNYSLTLNCSFDVISEKQILWWFEGNILFLGNKSTLEEVTNVQKEGNAKNSFLHIKGFHSNNTGVYECRRGTNDTGLFAYLYIISPITQLSLIVVNKSLTNATPVTLEKNRSYVFQCFGDEPSPDPFIWIIDNEKVGPANTSSFNPNPSPSSVLDSTKHLGSELFLHINDDIKVITCQAGKHSKSILIKVDSEPLALLDYNIFLIGTGGFALIVLLLASVCYCVCTCGKRKEKNPTSCQSSIYSMPSITANDHIDSTDHRRSRGDRDGMKDNDNIKVSARRHVSKNLSPFDLQYVDPIVQHPATNSFNTFERNLNAYGIQLHSMMSKDDLNEFWEASLCGGSFNEKIVVRSLSGKATVDLLEEFRKFMISLQELPSHPNIWSVIGISKEKLPYRICYEYHDQTTVRDYLLGNFQSQGDSDSPHNQTQTLVELAYEIADAMVFLKSYAFDHVAIRTEKILLDNTENCKIYDFSLSSQSQEIAINAVRENQILPWLAPELIFLEEYNQWTDIWAFGVVLWELWCGGRTPHCGKSRENLEKDLRNQQFLVQPPNCPGAVYSLMLSCWKNNASERKMFTDIMKAIDDLKTATESRWYGPEDYSTVGSSSFYTVLDNTYDAQ